jgi:hypothetical protein
MAAQLNRSRELAAFFVGAANRLGYLCGNGEHALNVGLPSLNASELSSSYLSGMDLSRNGTVSHVMSLTMPRSRPFQDINTAPRDGTAIEVNHGPKQEVVRAYWAGQNQAFVRDDEPDRKTLHRVTAWRPCPP